jgi:Animal haem peroxidase
MRTGQRDRDRPSEAQEGITRHGAAAPLGQDVDPAGGAPQRRYGRMFPCSGRCGASKDAIEALVKWMANDDPTRRSDNTDIPAGFTYLGQFIDHDITFDPMSKLDQRNDPNSLVNFRTPRFDLDSLYGSGPVDQPFLYEWKRSKPPGRKLLIARNSPDATAAGGRLASEDLPRNHQGRALIGDARNDENVILAQLHLLFSRFHNAVVDRLAREGGRDEDELFEEAQQVVRWHYQWIVMHEFLPMVVGEKMAGEVLEPGADGAAPTVRLKYFDLEGGPFIPVEFSGAAFRFGHSMVRSDYVLQRHARRGTPLFPDLGGLTWLPERHVIDWELFFMLPGASGAPQSSQLINTTIVKPLWKLPETGEALPRLNLQRGWALGLPSGQRVADAMDEPLLTEEELLLDDTIPKRARETLLSETPLWFYILCEAEKRLDRDGLPRAGSHLGPVGGRIVAEVLVGLLMADPTSYLSKEPGWRPKLGTAGKFGIADLIEVAQGAHADD